MLITLTVPDTVKPEILDKEKLTTGWDAPDTRPLTKKLGDKFLKANSGLLLAVPSVLIPEELNYVINPLHAEMKKVRIVHKEKLRLDKRFERRL